MFSQNVPASIMFLITLGAYYEDNILLKRHNQTEHVHRLELREFKNVAYLLVKREIRTQFDFGHTCPK